MARPSAPRPARAAPRPGGAPRCTWRTSRPTRSGRTTASWLAPTASAPAGPTSSSRTTGACSAPSRSTTACRAPPTAEDIALIDRATHLAGIAIEQRQLEGPAARPLGARRVRARGRADQDRPRDPRRAARPGAHRSEDGFRVARPPRHRSGAAAREAPRHVGGHRRDHPAGASHLHGGSAPGCSTTSACWRHIEWQAQEFQQRTGTTTTVESNGGDTLQLGRDVSTALFRIFQEALTNVARHAGAKHVGVRLGLEERRRGARGARRRQGASPRSRRANPRSLGLLGIRERARRLGGRAVVAANASGGTRVSIRVPRRRSSRAMIKVLVAAGRPRHRAARPPPDPGGDGRHHGRGRGRDGGRGAAARARRAMEHRHPRHQPARRQRPGAARGSPHGAARAARARPHDALGGPVRGARDRRRARPVSSRRRARPRSSSTRSARSRAAGVT